MALRLFEEVDALVRWPLPGLDAADPRVPTERARVVDGLVRWLDLVRTWNKKIDLTAAKTDADLSELGVLDAVEIAGRVDPRARRIVDVGTGFGAPGLAVAVLRPDLEVTLVEPLGKRASFLRTTIGALGATDRVTVAETKGEALAETGAAFDVAMSRATLSPPAWAALGSRLAPDGEVVVLLAREDVPVPEGREIAWTTTYRTRAGAPRVAAGLRRRAAA